MQTEKWVTGVSLNSGFVYAYREGKPGIFDTYIFKDIIL